jgi:hypothetical protein
MRNAALIVAALVVVLFLFSRHSSTASSEQSQVNGGSGTTTGHLSVVPTIRSVTVAPGAVTFRNCTGGSGYTNSIGTHMGYPNGSCSVGLVGVNESYPITVTYTGIPGKVFVSGSSAVPSDNGTAWTLCTPSSSTACTGGEGLPGSNQYMVSNFAEGVSDAGVLTTTPACDEEFNPAPDGGCSATPAEFKNQVQHEGLLLTGPESWTDHSTSWTITVTWTAIGPAS